MRYPALLRIYVPYSNGSERLFAIHVLGFLLGEPRKNNVISFNIREHACDPLKFKYVEEDLDNGRFDIVCHNVESDVQNATEAHELATNIEESLKRIGWIECNEDGVPIIPPVATVEGINSNDSAREFDECNCPCHHSNGRMMHCMPCCSQCPHCGRNIRQGSLKAHVVHCIPTT